MRVMDLPVRWLMRKSVAGSINILKRVCGTSKETKTWRK
jgi:hypothetical protein